jgi:hypothetical protein
MNRIPSFRSVMQFLLKLNDRQVSAMLANKKKVAAFLDQLAQEADDSVCFVPLSDPEAVNALNYDVPGKAQSMVSGWRRLASDLGYTGPVCWSAR